MRTYVNPIKDDADFADPFVLRHNGVYYLYCTHPRVQCWTSTDLVTWVLAGPTISDDVFPGEVPFAPEVVYADGWFYMYTSPHGRGHYVLRSRSPLGPFERVTDNLGRNIDGSVLIDDDGRWYFYYAGWEGVWACDMPSPTELGEPVLTGAHLNGWTEGPSVIKRDGRYVMTFTGNHFLSPGYRINVAVSGSPLEGFLDDPLNPAVVSTDGPTVGLGHSSTTTGPDLVSTYMAYHSIRPDAIRQLNIDRMVWIDGSLQVLGPSWGAVAPAAADVECRWDVRGAAKAWELPRGVEVDGQWLRVPRGTATWNAVHVGGPFTAELNVRAAGGVAITVAGDGGRLEIGIDAEARTVRSGDSTFDLPASFSLEAAHTVRIEYDGVHSTLYLDGRQISRTRADVDGGRISLASTAGFAIGYVGLTQTTPELADRAAVKPVPGRFWAGLAAEPQLGGERHAARRVLVAALGEVAWDVYVPMPGRYRVFATGEFAPSASLRVVTADTAAQFRIAGTVASAEVEWGEGVQTLRVVAGPSPVVIELVEIRSFTAESAYVVRERHVTGYTKELLDPVHLRDFRIAADVWVDRSAQHGHGDIIFRASELSLGYEGDDPRLGTDFFRGYSLQLHGSKIVLARHDYDATVLVSSAAPFSLGGVHHVEIQADGSRIEAKVDGSVVVSAEDPLPYVTGGIGLRAWESKIVAHELEVTVLA